MTRVRALQVGSGEEQIRATMDIMARVSASAASTARVVELAGGIVRGAGVSGHDLGAVARALREWVAQHVRFLSDPLVDGDWVRAPDYMLDEIASHGDAQGDCDDVAVLTAALGMAVGLFARFRAVAFSPEQLYSHVWVELWTGHEWLVVDPTRGRSLPLIHRSMVLEVVP